LLLKILPKQHTQAGRFPLLIFSTFALDARGQLTRLGYKVTNKAKCKILSRTQDRHTYLLVNLLFRAEIWTNTLKIYIW